MRVVINSTDQITREMLANFELGSVFQDENQATYLLVQNQDQQKCLLMLETWNVIPYDSITFIMQARTLNTMTLTLQA